MSATDTHLDPAPIAPPSLKAEPMGTPADFFDVVSKAGMRNVVSTYSPPDVRIHEGSRDFKAVRPGKVVYCIAEGNLPSNDRERNREILRRLAYGFHDWAARETVARYHRDLKRPAIQPQTSLAEGKASLKITRYLKANPGSSVSEIVAATGLAQPNVSRSISQWQASGKVIVERHGRLKKCFLSEMKDGLRGADASMRP